MWGVRRRRTLVAIDSSVSFATDGVGRPQCAYEMTIRSPEALDQSAAAIGGRRRAGRRRGPVWRRTGGRCGRSPSVQRSPRGGTRCPPGDPIPTFYPSPALGDAGAGRDTGLRRAGQPDRRRPSRRHHRRRRRPHLGVLRPAHRGSRDDPPRRRAASLRLERLLLDALPERAAPACRAALPDRPGPRLLPHLHHRHQARPDAAPDRQDDRAGGGGGRGWVRQGAHRPLRTRTASMSAPSARPTARVPAASSCSTTTPSTCSAAGRSTAASSTCTTTSGGTSATTPWSAASGARRTWSRPGCSRSCCSMGSTGTASISGICGSAATRRRSIWARSTRSPSSCARRTTRPRPTASSTPSSV